jgi:predicted RNase H-like HicB family nuclease
MELDQILEALAAGETVPVADLTNLASELGETEQTLKASIKEAAANHSSLDDLVAMKGEYDNVVKALATVTEAQTEAQAAIDAIVADVRGQDRCSGRGVHQGVRCSCPRFSCRRRCHRTSVRSDERHDYVLPQRQGPRHDHVG